MRPSACKTRGVKHLTNTIEKYDAASFLVGAIKDYMEFEKGKHDASVGIDRRV